MSNCPYAKVHPYQSLHRLLGQSGIGNYPVSVSIHLFSVKCTKFNKFFGGIWKMKFTVRKVDTRIPSIQTTLGFLQRKILPDDVPYDTTRGHWWIAYAECGKPVGFAGLVRSTRWNDTGYFCRAGVMDGFTGHGLQKRLIKARLAKARWLGWNWCITDTTDNPASSNSLIGCGFKMYTPANPWSFKNACYWKYKVNQDAVQRRERKKKQAQSIQP